MSKRILVVDDEENVARNFEAILTGAGYDVTVATDGYDALEKVAAGNYDLITMDLRMPKLDGIQATKQIMDLIRLRRVSTPVIIISGYLFDHKKELRQLPTRYILEKPVGIKDLLKTVKQALEED